MTDSKEMQQINAAISEWNRYTCIQFRRANSQDNNRIRIQDGGG